MVSLLMLQALVWAPASARVDVSLDLDSLNKMLTAMAPGSVSVPLMQGRSVNLKLEDLRVTGFEPAEGEGNEGFLRTSVRLKVPELGLDLPLEPRLSLQVRDKGSSKTCYLRFEKVMVTLPVTGALDIAPLLPLLPLPSDTSWTVAASSGDVRVRTRLVEARMGAKMLRLGFDLDAEPVSGSRP
jgi:hypothetical protein